jgi:hypothetical protein
VRQVRWVRWVRWVRLVRLVRRVRWVRWVGRVRWVGQMRSPRSSFDAVGLRCLPRWMWPSPITRSRAGDGLGILSCGGGRIDRMVFVMAVCVGQFARFVCRRQQ